MRRPIVAIEERSIRAFESRCHKLIEKGYKLVSASAFHNRRPDMARVLAANVQQVTAVWTAIFQSKTYDREESE